MSTAPADRALLVLEDGRTFYGHRYGAAGEAFGEAVFTTGMTGYQETLTDPSYVGQVVVQTAPHIGNTGINLEDPESAQIWVAGYVVREPSRMSSSWRSSGTLDDALGEAGVVGISGIDTRALTRHLRENGTMRVGISTVEPDPQTLLRRVRETPEMTGADLLRHVTTSEPYVVAAETGPRFRVAVLDLGLKSMTTRRLAERGIEVHVLPATSTWEEVAALDPDGLFYSNGPGDPATAIHQIELLRTALGERLPFFGICFGNQLFGLALGFGTYKLDYGHRGMNQPVRDRATGSVEITSHNHGFAVDVPAAAAQQTEFGRAEVSHVCLNDDVVEGLALAGTDGRALAFSVQFHPESAAGPHDSAHLFDKFCALMEGSSR